MRLVDAGARGGRARRAGRGCGGRSGRGAPYPGGGCRTPDSLARSGPRLANTTLKMALILHVVSTRRTLLMDDAALLQLLQPVEHHARRFEAAEAASYCPPEATARRELCRRSH